MHVCARCLRTTMVTVMSIFNTEILCPGCKDEEKNDPRYEDARRAEAEAVKAGDYNFPGIGR